MPAPTTAAQSAAWVMDTALVPAQETFTRSKAFDLTPCGINPELFRRPRKCMGWGVSSPGPWLPPKQTRTFCALPPSMRKAPTGVAVLVDFNSDGRITDDDVLIPWSQIGRRGGNSPMAPLSAWTSRIPLIFSSPTKPALDHPLRGCLAGVADPEKTCFSPYPSCKRKPEAMAKAWPASRRGTASPAAP